MQLMVICLSSILSGYWNYLLIAELLSGWIRYISISSSTMDLYIIHFFFQVYWRRETKIFVILTVAGPELILTGSVNVIGTDARFCQLLSKQETLPYLWSEHFHEEWLMAFTLCFSYLGWHHHVPFLYCVNMVDYVDWILKTKFLWDAWNNWYLVMA